MKLEFIISGIIVVIVTTSFFGMNLYEHKNNCILKYISITEPVTCVKNYVKTPHRSGPFNSDLQIVSKPLILLYPTSDTRVDVSLSYIPWFSATFPQYNFTKKWWSVLAHSDGTLKDSWTNQDTYGLFWEWNWVDASVFDLSKWFIVRGTDIREFLYTKLTAIGLNTKEKSDFIMFWYPKLQNFPYVQITFAGKDYTDLAKLDIHPKPDSLLRVFIVAKPLTESIQIPKQNITPFERKWFSVVEWGGTIVQ